MGPNRYKIPYGEINNKGKNPSWGEKRKNVITGGLKRKKHITQEVEREKNIPQGTLTEKKSLMGHKRRKNIPHGA